MTEEQALSRLAALCSQAEHCIADMTRRLNQWGISPDVQQRIIDYLIREGYIDERRYCRCLIEEKIRYNGWGRRKIEQALYAKQIDRQISQKALDEVPDDAYAEVLRPLLQQKWHTISAQSDYERSMKLIRWAMGRGYDYEIIKTCTDHLSTLPDD